MTARTLRLSDEADAALRAQAGDEGRSLNAVAEAAILEYRTRHATRQRVDVILDELAPRYDALLDRLGNA
jgi:hypothetical protein